MNLIAMVLLSVVQASQPELVGAELTPLARAADLPSDVAGVDGWVGYAVPAVAGAHRGCNGVFDLDRGGSYTSTDEVAVPERLYVFSRVIDGRVTEVRSVTSGCRIRAGGGPVYWLSSVTPEESLRFLEALARRDPTSELTENVVHAVAWHAGAEADALVGAFVSAEWPLDVREKAVFWMGAARGERGYRALVALFDRVPERELREKIVFALHVSDADDATPMLIRIARDDADTEVRGKALFWLAQQAGTRAAEAIAGAVRDDPDLEVKKKAVFALSQLPPDEGVPLLVEVAETHPQPEIRKKAFFWLGQTQDPRALALFEKVLTN